MGLWQDLQNTFNPKPEVDQLNALFESGKLRPQTMLRVMQEYNMGKTSAELLPTITPDDFVKTPEEQAQALEQAKLNQQQNQSKQIAQTLTDQLLGQSQGINQQVHQHVQSNPSLTSLLTGGDAGGAYQPITPDAMLTPQLQAQMAMYRHGLGDTDYQNVVKNFGPLLQTPEPQSPSEQWRSMQNQAIQALTQGTPEWGKTMLPNVHPSTQDEWTEARQKAAQGLAERKFTYQQKKDIADLAMEEKKLVSLDQSRRANALSRAQKLELSIRTLPIRVQDKARSITNDIEKLKQNEVLEIDRQIEDKKSTLGPYLSDPNSPVVINYKKQIEDLEGKRQTVIDYYDTKAESQITDLKNVNYEVGKIEGLEQPRLDLIKQPEVTTPGNQSDLPARIQQALQKGYTAQQIWDRLQNDNRIQQAISKGYTAKQIQERLGLSLP